MVTAAQAYWLNRKRRQARNAGAEVSIPAPAAFTDGQWTLAPNGTSGMLLGTITALPNLNGGTLQRIDYTLDSANWYDTGIAVPVSVPVQFLLSGLTDGISQQVQIRAVTNGGAGAASDMKSATPGAGSTKFDSTTAKFDSTSLKFDRTT